MVGGIDLVGRVLETKSVIPAQVGAETDAVGTTGIFFIGVWKLESKNRFPSYGSSIKNTYRIGGENTVVLYNLNCVVVATKSMHRIFTYLLYSYSMIQIDFRYRTCTYCGFFELPVTLESLLSYEAVTIPIFKNQKDM
jgi:hypothetical protein